MTDIIAKNIEIEWISGRPDDGGEDDAERAALAAEHVLDAAGSDPVAAEAEYMAQWGKYNDEALMTGLAGVWVDARNAANRALTEGWAIPGNACCSIRTK